MSSKPKALLKQSKSKHKKEQVLDTADDYQAAGVDFEDAAGKWRAGDAVKSMRFFHRALEVYDQGLQRFPRSFDLAYNKARVQLEIATHPILVKQLQQPVLAVLREALESHRQALTLTQDNADVLFNTAQVLTSIAEEIAKSDDYDDAEAIHYLEEALELQNRCLSLQELKYDNSQEQDRIAQQTDISAEDGGVDVEEDDNGGAPIPAHDEQEDQWFSIVEPVTQDTLIDTALAQMGTLTTLCGILSSSPSAAPPATLAWVEEYSATILNKKLPFFVRNQQGRHVAEVALVKANFVSAMLEAGFRAGRLDAVTYKQERDAVFSVSELELEKSVEALLANTRSLMSFNSALAESGSQDGSGSATLRWNLLSAATTNLASASKIAGIGSEDLSKTHLLRGDCSMLQRQMGLEPTRYQSAVTNAGQLLKNAQVFYTNAGKLSTNPDEKAIAGFRLAIARYLHQNDKSLLISAAQNRSEAWAVEQLDDMVLEGLLPVGFQIL